MKSRNRQQTRIVPLLVGLFYAFVSFSIVFQHSHRDDDEVLIRLIPSSAASKASTPQDLKLAANKTLPDSGPCAACEWQAANVSAAVTSPMPILERPTVERARASDPTCPNLRIVSTPSRAPPVA